MAKIKRRGARLICVALSMLISALIGLGTAMAQTGPYETTATRAIDDTVTCGVSSFTRTINVADNFTIADLDVGFLASHSWRGDIRVDLSHNGVTRRIITSDTSGVGSDDNYNVVLDDEAGTLIRTAPHDTNDGLVAPPYENRVRPSSSLSVFDGQNANGTWTFTICDDFNGADDGQFLRANLYFTATTSADLSYALSAAPNNPAIGSNVSITAIVTNSGPQSASGITANVVLPGGLTYVSGGSSVSGSNVTITVPGTLASGASSSATIIATVQMSGGYEVLGEILSSSRGDGDSTPSNGFLGEDDDDSVLITPAVAPPPSLTCAAPLVHDWDSYGWTAGALTQTNATSGETLVATFSGSTASLQANPAGGALPAVSDYDAGGLLPTEDSILLLVDFPNQAAEIIGTFQIGAPGVGVDELQFALFDVDFGTGQFEDRIVVTGSLNGAPVAPVLTRSIANVVAGSGNVALGIAAANNAGADGTATVTFFSPVDEVTIIYGSGVNTPADPGLQAISIHDFSTCERTFAVLNASKTNEIYDPSSEGLFSIPGNDVIYTFTVTNTGSGDADADSVVLIDVMPEEIEFYNGDIDDGGPETSPVSFSQTGSAAFNLTYGSDVRFSNSSAKPANFADCTYAPVNGYDPNVSFICFNPKGVFEAGNPDPEFTIKFRARIR